MGEKPREGGMPELSSNPDLDNIKIILGHYADVLPCINI